MDGKHLSAGAPGFAQQNRAAPARDGPVAKLLGIFHRATNGQDRLPEKNPSPPKEPAVRVELREITQRFLHDRDAIMGLISKLPPDERRSWEELMGQLDGPDGSAAGAANANGNPVEVSQKSMSALFGQVWTPEDYDHHMLYTGHDSAVAFTIMQAAELQRMEFGDPTAHAHIFGRKIWDMSCGTGTGIKLLCENLKPVLGPEGIRGVTVIANDISDGMKSAAKRKLRNVCRVGGYPREDIRYIGSQAKKVDTAVLSQTLHLITDPYLVAEEKRTGRPDLDTIEAAEHLTIKAKVVADAFEKLNWGGHFVLIDEWSPVLTNNNANPLAPDIDALFHENFRPVRYRSTFRDHVMSGIKSACFVAELKARIDGYHSMYIIIYRKDQNRKRNGIKTLAEAVAGGELHPEAAGMARGRAMRDIYAAFVSTDVHFIKNFRPTNGSSGPQPEHAQPGAGQVSGAWSELKPLGVGPTLLSATDPEIPLSAIAGETYRAGGTGVESFEKALAARKYNTIVIAQLLHEVDSERRIAMVRNAINALEIGGSLMFIDEWPVADGKQTGIRNRDFRDGLMNQFKDLIFEGALRETIVHEYDGGIYGYLYRKIR